MKSPFTCFLGLLFFSCLVTWYACQKHPLVDTPSVPVLPESVTATIKGRVLNDRKEPVSEAMVKVNGNTTIRTDINGNFRFNNILLNKNAGFVQVEKDGYFAGSRTVLVNKDTVNYLQIELISKKISGTFDAATGGSVMVASGGSIDFSQNSMVTTTSNIVYNGSVSVSAFFINPEAANFTYIMPGDLRGINTANQERGLQSFGMMAVEVSGSGGEKLQLAPGKTASVHFPIPATLQGQAPATIPLWYFNDSTGLWKEQGSATRQGTKYTGTVSHFSFWNCDAPFPVIDFSAVLIDQNGNPLVQTKVYIHKAKTNISSSAYTDASGKIFGKIPSNETLEMSLYNKCDTQIFSKVIGPFTSTTNLGAVSITVPAQSSVVISGTVVNCAGQSVDSGYVNLLLEGSNYRGIINKGQFSVMADRCSNTPASAQLYAVDLKAIQQSAAVALLVGNANSNAGQLSVCGVLTNEYINYTINNVQYILTSPLDTVSASFLSASNTNIRVLASSQPPQPNRFVYFTFSGAGQAPGTYPLSYLNIYSRGGGDYARVGNINVNITEYGGVGQFIAGNFGGNLKDSINPSTILYPFNLSFRIRRRN